MSALLAASRRAVLEAAATHPLGWVEPDVIDPGLMADLVAGGLLRPLDPHTWAITREGVALVRPSAGDVVQLLRDMDDMTARAGGWTTQIPRWELDRWRARKDRIVALVEATATFHDDLEEEQL